MLSSEENSTVSHKKIDLAGRGEEEMVVQIYHKYRQTIFNYIFFRLGDGQLSEDLTSEVFVRVVDKLDHAARNGRPLAPWLYTIARNLVVDHYRKSSRVISQPLDDRLPGGKANDPQHVTDLHLTSECLTIALAHLTEEQRRVILLKFIERRSNAEIGMLLDKTEGSIKSLQHRALAALRRTLDEEACYEA
jgi:RNA polymerase sigma-70 factor, ECF subfamily